MAKCNMKQKVTRLPLKSVEICGTDCTLMLFACSVWGSSAQEEAVLLQG